MDSYLKGSFSKDQAKYFLDALRDIQKCKVQQILFNIDKTDKNVKLFVINDENTILSHVNIKSDVFSDFEIETDFVFGIYDLHEFTSLLSILDGGYEMEMNRSVCQLSKDNANIKYYAADSDLIREGKKTLNAKIEWLTELEICKDKHSNFIKAVPVIGGKFVIMEGKKGNDTVTLHVKDKDISSSNSYSINVEVDEITKDFKVILDKDNFMNVIQGSSESYLAQISNVTVSFYGETDGHTIKTYVGPRTD